VFQVKVLKKIKIFYVQQIFFSENRALYEIMWKNVVEPEMPQTTVQYGACALYAG